MALKSRAPPAASYGSLSAGQWKYDVFVSFRGEDVRKNFADHLFAALDQKGILAFRDDQRLERGKPIAEELPKAIEESRFCIILFSENYCTSSWCLDELLKILENMKEKGQEVVPLFYDVDPSEVSEQSGNYGKALAEHEKASAEKAEKVKKWRAALTEIAALHGWELKDKHEAGFIQEIVQDIFSKLTESFSCVAKYLVGIEARLEEMDSILGMGLDDVRMIGIWGMGGIGKTTLARVIYDKFSHQFEGRTFISNVREAAAKQGLAPLQELILADILKERINIWDVHRGLSIVSNRLKRKRVLIVLDDVNELDQLRKLAGENDWFGPGSRIIITSRDEHVLSTHGVDALYKARALYGDEALQLLCLKAFKQNHPADDFVQLSKRVLYYADGLPLALEVLGSFLYGRSVIEWESALKRLKEIPDKEICSILEISYDGLEEIDKRIFLDISCFFRGKKIERLYEVLNSFDFTAEIGIRNLIDRSLATIEFGKIWIHSLLQEMGWHIVRRESQNNHGKSSKLLKDPGERSRLWLHEDIQYVLTKNKGTEAVEGIYLKSLENKEICLNSDSFSKLTDLRLLKIHDVHMPKGLEFLPDKLRILKWDGYPLQFLPPSFKPEELAELNLCHSNVKELWKGIMKLDRLRVIKLSHSRKLIKTPDFTGMPNLEKLILEGSTSLYEVHSSIGGLRRLTILNLKDCQNLWSVPSSICAVKSLKILYLRGCTKLDKLPENLGNLEDLEELDVGETPIRKVPSSLLLLRNLKILSFHGCKGQPPKTWGSFFRSLLPGALSKPTKGFLLPSSFLGLWSLRTLDLSDCNIYEGAIPALFTLSTLKKLDLSRNHFVTLPPGINQLTQLQDLNLESCKKLESLPELPSSIEDLCTYNCSSLKALSIPNISTSRHREFKLNNCFELLDSQGNSTIVLTILESHIHSLAEVQLLLLLSKFLQSNNQNREDVLITVPESYAGSLVNSLLEGFSAPPAEAPKLNISLSGSGIPSWFTYQTTEPSVTIQLPPNWHEDDSIVGLAICAAFKVEEQPTSFRDDLPSGPRTYKFDYQLVAGVRNDNLAPGHAYKMSFRLLSDTPGHLIYGIQRCFIREVLAASDHLWVVFIPFDEYLHKYNWKHVTTQFKAEGRGFEFKKCGVRFVFLNDAFEMSQSEMVRINIPFSLLSARFPIFGMAAEVPLIEHSHDEAGPSESSSCDGEPQGTTMEESSDAMLKGKLVQE